MSLRLAVSVGSLLCVSCVTIWAAQFAKPGAAPVDPGAPFLKAHTEAGEVYVLTDWKVDETARTLSGTGRWYSVTRDEFRDDAFTVGFDAVALIETNSPNQVLQAQFVVLGVASGVSAALSALCLSSPKTCFGSCPTFYVPGEDQPRAEGFSRSIARALEATDLDALDVVHERGGTFRLLMRNEALETHALRRLQLLALAAPQGGRVMRANIASSPCPTSTPLRVARLRATTVCRRFKASGMVSTSRWPTHMTSPPARPSS